MATPQRPGAPLARAARRPARGAAPRRRGPAAPRVGPRGGTLGVLGGGQLGQMLALKAAQLGVRVRVLDPAEGCPSALAGAEQSVGSFRDRGQVEAFAAGGLDVLTCEIEHVDAGALEAVAAAGVDVQPTPGTLAVIQDKLEQKRHFRTAGVALGDFAEVGSEAGLRRAAAAFGYPLMLKSRRLAYDGRGNAAAAAEAGLLEAAAALGGFERGLYAERWVPFEKELAVMVARSKAGEVRAYPVVETFHRDSILHVTECPADVPAAVAAKARAMALDAVSSLEGAGVFGVEMFLCADGRVLLNEVAPRPHNSGHYTIEACAASQFEQHLRAVMGLPLGDPSLVVGAAIMLNVLGEAEGAEGVEKADRLARAALGVPGAHLHWYGKEGVRKQRKIGHVTIVAKDLPTARRRLRAVQAVAAGDPSGAPAAELSGAGPPPEVAVVMGSDSDLSVMGQAADVLEDFGVPCEVTVVSAHRTPERMVDFARNAHKRGVKVIIAGAGGAAHLPGMVAAMTPLPVVGVPVKPEGAHLDGVDSLLSIVQMPRGVPVATVAIGNATNAGLLAVRMLGTADAEAREKMAAYQESMRDTVLAKADKLERQPWKEYLEDM